MMFSAMLLAAALNVPEIAIHEKLPPYAEADRIFKDVAVQLDLSRAKAISFDFTCGNLRPFRGFTLYFKCGEKWIQHPVTPEKLSGSVERFEFPIEEFGVDKLQDANSLTNVTVVRFAGGRYTAEETMADVVVRNFAMSETPLPKREVAVPLSVEPVPAKPGERRLICCHRAWGKDSDPGVSPWDEQIAMLKRAGFTDILLNVAWAGKAYYKSAVYPEDPTVEKYGDQLELCRAACRKHGMKFHAWKCFWRLGAEKGPRAFDPAYRARMAREGRLALDASDLKTGAPHLNVLCPNHPDNIREETASMVELAKKDVDGIMFDYIRYYSGKLCICPRCRVLFEGRIGRTVPNWPDALLSDPCLKAEWTRFRCDTISSLVKEISETVRRECPKVEISASVIASSERAKLTVCQDWGAWARAGWLDFVMTMGYASSYSLHRESRMGVVLQEKNPITVYPGIGLSVWQNDGLDGVRLREQMLSVRELGFKGFFLFEWSSRAERNLGVFANLAE